MTGVTVRTRRDGTLAFEAQVARPRVNGKAQSPLSKTFPTERQAQDWHDATLARCRTKAAAPHTLATWTAAYLPKALHLSPSARVYDADRMRLHVNGVLGDMLLTDIRQSHVNDLLADLLHREVRPLSHASTARIRAILGQILQGAQQEGLIPANPAEGVRLPRRTKPQREIVAWSPTQVDAFLTQPTTKASPLHSLLVAAFYLGARRGELLGLTPDDVHLTGPKPHVLIRRSLHQDGTVGAPKSEKGRRRLPLVEWPKAQAALQEQLHRRAGQQQQQLQARLAPQLWLKDDGAVLSPSHVSQATQVLIDGFVDSPAGRAVHAGRLTFHGARHSWVTNCINAGMRPDVVSKLAGHASMAFTIDRYGHLLESHDELVMSVYA